MSGLLKVWSGPLFLKLVTKLCGLFRIKEKIIKGKENLHSTGNMFLAVLEGEKFPRLQEDGNHCLYTNGGDNGDDNDAGSERRRFRKRRFGNCCCCHQTPHDGSSGSCCSCGRVCGACFLLTLLAVMIGGFLLTASSASSTLWWEDTSYKGNGFQWQMVSQAWWGTWRWPTALPPPTCHCGENNEGWHSVTFIWPLLLHVWAGWYSVKGWPLDEASSCPWRHQAHKVRRDYGLFPLSVFLGSKIQLTRLSMDFNILYVHMNVQ